MKKILPIVFSILILTGISATQFDSAFAQTPSATPSNFKVAFIGDQGYYEDDAELVLQLIDNEGADMVLHQGDFDYNQSPTDWDDMITSELGLNFPYFGSVGNHDLELDQWPNYQQKLQERLDRVDGANCTGDLGNKSSCHYQGLFFILSGIGTIGSGTSGSSLSDHVSYIEDELEQDNSIWSLCTWHKNHQQMQVGGKGTEVSMQVYDACREGGAIIATGHEHSYSRTKTLTNMMDGSGNVQLTVDPAWSDPGEVRVADGATFSFVSGLGGKSVREQLRCLPQNYPYGCNGEWASIYSGTQDSRDLSGALFCEFNYNGQADKAFCYFKNTEGQIIDEFNITSFMGVEIPPEPPVTYDQAVSTFENIPIDISLSASDANGDPLTYIIVSGPSNGSLSGTDSFRTYTPNAGFTGSDSFTFKANDGTADSNVSTVTIAVDAIPSSGTLNIRVNSGDDDVEESSSGSMYITSSDLELVDDSGSNGSDQTVGIRFTSINVPQGSTITSAYIEFETDTTDSVSTSLTIHAQDSDNAPSFSSATNNVSSREQTSASVAWNPAEWNTASQKHQTPSLSPLVKEVVDRSGWNPGNDMVFIITGTGTRTAEAYEGESANAPLLHIEYDITQPNEPPTTTQIGDYIVFENAVDTVITLTSHFDDAEDGPTGLTYTVFTNDNLGLVGTSISGGSLTLSYATDTSGEANITVRATDSGSLTVDDTFKVTVLEVNDPPTANAGDNQNIDENILVNLSGSGTDTDGTIDIYAWTQTAGTTVTLSDDTSQSPSFTSPEVGPGGETLTFSLIVTDNGSASSDADTVDINVADVLVPTITIHVGDLDVSKTGKKNWHARVLVTVHDEGDSAVSNITVSGDWSGDETSSSSCITDELGQCEVSESTRGNMLTFTVTGLVGVNHEYESTSNHDSDGDSDGSVITIYKDGTIPGVNVAPQFTSDPIDGQSVSDGQQYSGTLADDATDSNGDTLTFSKQSGPTWLNVSSDGILSGTATMVTLLPETQDFVVQVSDPFGLTDTATLQIQITEPAPQEDIHIGLIDGTTAPGKGQRWTATMDFYVHESNHLSISGVTVSGDWSDDANGSASCVTDANGMCSVSKTIKGGSQATFTVDTLTGQDVDYVSSDNDVANQFSVSRP